MARWRYASISDHVVVVMLNLLNGSSQFVVKGEIERESFVRLFSSNIEN
jgi:hypothetical protein